jgi:hypothetical protein
MMPMIDLFQHAVQLAAHALMLADAEDLSHLVGGQAEESQFGGALKDLVNGEIASEDHIEGVLNLIQGIGPPRSSCLTTRSSDRGPMEQRRKINERAKGRKGVQGGRNRQVSSPWFEPVTSMRATARHHHRHRTRVGFKISNIFGYY